MAISKKKRRKIGAKAIRDYVEAQCAISNSTLEEIRETYGGYLGGMLLWADELAEGKNPRRHIDWALARSKRQR